MRKKDKREHIPQRKVSLEETQDREKGMALQSFV